MKTNQIISWATVALALLGVTFKEMHWNGGNIIVMLALLALVIAAVLSFKENKLTGLSDPLNYSLTAMLVVIVLAIGFGYFHWTGSAELRLLGLGVFALLPVIVNAGNSDNKISNSFWVTLLTSVFIVVFLQGQA